MCGTNRTIQRNVSKLKHAELTEITLVLIAKDQSGGKMCFAGKKENSGRKDRFCFRLMDCRHFFSVQKFF